MQCLKKVLKCRFTDARTDLLRINCVYLTLTLSTSAAAASRDKRHKGVLFNLNHAELSLRVLVLSHKPGCEGVGGQGLEAGSEQGGSARFKTLNKGTARVGSSVSYHTLGY